ncbi:hypothetical protein CRE_07864 [Caenorhabditis remanei]|uniref:DNA2/NAM7 helicase-like C-terminal domain-containing protein n=1 Tax=Caenorhabditis remanei TaxID=31234 RepID=E3NJH5_CAERE|nr:hypothetical protein CRE_07864 [Caenorhabditis remanei]
MKILQLLMATYPRNSPRPAPPPQVRWAPMVQITAHVSLCPGNPLVRVTLDLTPFERETYGTRPLQTFEMMDYRLVPCRPRAPAIVHPANAGVRAETFTGSTQTWVRRRAAENHGLRCCCDAMYSHPERRHDSKGMCTAWAVGQMIAEKIWAGDDIKPPMVHEPHPTTPPHNRRLWAPIVEIRVTVYRHRCGISVEAAVNQSPFGPVLQLADRVRFYHILDNQLWSVFENPFGLLLADDPRKRFLFLFFTSFRTSFHSESHHSLFSLLVFLFSLLLPFIFLYIHRTHSRTVHSTLAHRAISRNNENKISENTHLHMQSNESPPPLERSLSEILLERTPSETEQEEPMDTEAVLEHLMDLEEDPVSPVAKKMRQANEEPEAGSTSEMTESGVQSDSRASSRAPSPAASEVQNPVHNPKEAKEEPTTGSTSEMTESRVQSDSGASSRAPGPAVLTISASEPDLVLPERKLPKNLVEKEHHPWENNYNKDLGHVPKNVAKAIAASTTIEDVQEFRNKSVQWARAVTPSGGPTLKGRFVEEMKTIKSRPQTPGVIYILKSSNGNLWLATPLNLEVSHPDRPDLHGAYLSTFSEDLLNVQHLVRDNANALDGWCPKNKELQSVFQTKEEPSSSCWSTFLRIYKPNVLFGTAASMIEFLYDGPLKNHRNTIITNQIDEASQFPMHQLITLGSLCPNARYALIGDVRQLAPYAHTGLSNEFKKIAVGALLESAAKSIPVFSIMTVRRCPQKLTQVCSDLFYGGKLKSARSSTEPNPYTECLGIESKFPIQIITTEGEDQLAGTSRLNVEEAGIAAAIVKKIQGAHPSKTVAVLTFYKAQCGHLSRMDALNNSFVGTIDASQGMEFDVTIVLTTKSSDFNSKDAKEDQATFVEDVRRINVALSRAKGQVFVLLNRKAAETSKIWNLFFRKVPKGATHRGSRFVQH